MPASQSPDETAAQPIATAGDTLDLRQYWTILLRRRWIVVAAFALVVIATVAYTLRQPKIYRAVATIIIELGPPKVLDTAQVQEILETGSAGWWGRDYYETQYKVLTSRAVAARVAERLGLANDLRFLGLDKIDDAALRERRRQAADPAGMVQGKLKVEPVKDSRVVRLAVEDTDPELAATIANAFAEAYIAETLAVKNVTTASASEWLEQQIADLEGKLEKSGKELFEFKKKNDIVSTTWEDRQSMVSQRLTAINDALSKARVQRAQLQARSEAIDQVLRSFQAGDGDLESLPAISSSAAIQSLKQKYFETRTDCADLKIKYLDQHPRLQVCEEKLKLARTNLQHEIKTALLAAQREYQEVRQTEKNLVALYNETKDEAFGFNRHEQEYHELKRAYDNNQRLYDMLLKRLKDAGLAGMLQMSNVRILDRARPSFSPVRPKVQQNILAGLLLGLLAGIGLAIVVEYLDNTIRGQEHVERLGLPFLGIIPRVPLKDGQAAHLVVHEQPKSTVAECCRTIRTNLLFMSPDHPIRTILVTSAAPKEGKTTTSIDLAIAMADSGNRVLLIDADMRRPRIHKAFELPNGAGLSSLILGEGNMEDTILSTGVPNLSAVTCGPIPPSPSELLHSAGFTALLGRLSQQFDRIIIDSPPVAAVSDALIIATQVDGAVLVVKAGKTTREAVQRAARSLGDVKARILGAILNDIDMQDSRYGGYYYAYGQYYGEKREGAASS